MAGGIDVRRTVAFLGAGEKSELAHHYYIPADSITERFITPSSSLKIRRSVLRVHRHPRRYRHCRRQAVRASPDRFDDLIAPSIVTDARDTL